MRFICLVEPKGTIPTNERQNVSHQTLQWYKEEKGNFELFGALPNGGCFCVIDVDNAEDVQRIVCGCPLASYSKIKTIPFVEGEAGLQQWQETLTSAVAGRDR